MVAVVASIVPCEIGSNRMLTSWPNTTEAIPKYGLRNALETQKSSEQSSFRSLLIVEKIETGVWRRTCGIDVGGWDLRFFFLYSIVYCSSQDNKMKITNEKSQQQNQLHNLILFFLCSLHSAAHTTERDLLMKVGTRVNANKIIPWRRSRF